MTTLIEANVLAGPFTLAYTPAGGSSGSLGIIGSEGINWRRELNGEPIDSDQYGKGTILDGVYTGGNLFLSFLLQEANLTAVKQMAYAFNATATASVKAGLENELGIPGVLWSTGGGVLVATPVAGTKAASQATPTRTFGAVCPMIGHQVQQALRAGLRTIPMTLICLPYDLGSGKIGTHSLS